MSKAKHTPGPWEIDDTNEIYAPRADRSIGDIYGELEETKHGGIVSEDRANGLLCAAAPDLLAALEAIVAGLGATEENDGSKPVWRAAFAAIAKARGEAA